MSRVGEASEHGGTLVEVMFAMLIVSLAVVGVYSVLGASRDSHLQLDERAVVDESIASAADALKDYVTADASAATAAMAPGGSWKFPGDTCTDCWALSIGDHDASGFITDKLKECYPSATLTYTVSCPSGVSPCDDAYQGPRVTSFSIDRGTPASQCQ